MILCTSIHSKGNHVGSSASGIDSPCSKPWESGYVWGIDSFWDGLRPHVGLGPQEQEKSWLLYLLLWSGYQLLLCWVRGVRKGQMREELQTVSLSTASTFRELDSDLSAHPLNAWGVPNVFWEGTTVQRTSFIICLDDKREIWILRAYINCHVFHCWFCVTDLLDWVFFIFFILHQNKTWEDM